VAIQFTANKRNYKNCPECGSEVTVPEVLVRRTGLLRCDCGAVFPRVNGDFTELLSTINEQTRRQLAKEDQRKSAIRLESVYVTDRNDHHWLVYSVGRNHAVLHLVGYCGSKKITHKELLSEYRSKNK
jgi:hypothetical protein